ncbi:cation diffusion facilitator family transporter [delta proteobacterium NaphS2]|nr:cation diffusion facilitator family transporter [delta proteobacterium NaphS2]
MLMAAKFYAFHLTGSSAVFSDALESIINVVASAFAFASIVLAAKPPDKSHPYGHGKVEYFSAGFEGALIIIAAVGIFKTGWDHFIRPQSLPNLAEGLYILLGAGLINLILGLVLVRAGKKTESLALRADGKHILTDVITSAGVLAALLLVHLTGLYWLDGAVACMVGFSILYTGISLVKESYAGLMDKAEPALLKEISALLKKHRKNIWAGIHELKAFRSGNFINVSLHLILPRDFTLEEAHRESEVVEMVIRDHFKGRASVLVHTDPCADPDCPACRRHTCELRKKMETGVSTWTAETLISERRGKPPLWN